MSRGEDHPLTVERWKVALLQRAVRGRFLRDEPGNAVITALEGLKWVLGDDAALDDEQHFLEMWAEGEP